MRIFVAGGAGYIGGHAARALTNRGYDVVLYDNLSTGHAWMAGDLPLVVGDIRDRDKLLEVLPGCDAIMHFAALAYVGESVTEPRQYFDTNVEGALTLLNCSIDLGIDKFVLSSTCATYGAPAVVPISDTTVQNPISPYGDSKLFVERALRAYSRAYNLKSVSLRYFNAAGADETAEIGELHSPETHLIPSAFEAVRGKRPALTIYGSDYPTPDGTCIRDYIHVSDLAEAHALALDYLNKGGESATFNLGTEKGYSVLEVLEAIRQVTGREVPARYAARREGDPPVLVANAARAQEVLKWKPQRNLRDIVDSAWRWFQVADSKPDVTSTCLVRS